MTSTLQLRVTRALAHLVLVRRKAMPSIALAGLITLLAAQAETPDGPRIRDETVEEEDAVMASSLAPARELARNYSAYLGKTLTELGMAGDLAMERERRWDHPPPARPTDSAIRSAVRDFVLDNFPIDSSIWEIRNGRYVVGKLAEGRTFKIRFLDGVAVDVMFRINQGTDVVFHLRKR